MSDQTGVLYVIGTPIGNLHDTSSRAKAVLQEVDLILAEDTRQSRKLLNHLGVKTPMQAYHEFNERETVPDLIRSLQSGKNIALISDAGTPLICDPGYLLVRGAHEHGIKLVPVPGPSAFLAALSVSGFTTGNFIFEGFLPEKQTARIKRLKELAGETRTMVFYEAPHRILDFLQDVIDVFGNDRLICLCRELTKKFETIYRNTCGNVLEILKDDPHHQKGEFVAVLNGSEREVSPDRKELIKILEILLGRGLSVKEACKITVEITGARKNELYKLALELTGSSGNQS